MTKHRDDPLGLRRGTVCLTDYQAAWHDEFEAERGRLAILLANVSCQIEHVGSTAVPGLTAKPILDLAVGVTRENDVAPVQATLAGAGYLYRGDLGGAGGHLFVRESA